MELLHVADAGLVGYVQCGALVRVLAVAERLLPLEHQAERRRERFLRACEVGQDCGVVRGGMREHFGGERLALIRRDATILEARDNGGVVVRIDDHDHRLVVLRRRAEHRRAADIDLLDRLRERRLRLGDRLPKRIEIDGDEVDWRDAMQLHRRQVAGVISSC